MFKIVVCVSGGGTNLQAIIDGVHAGSIPNVEILRVVSNNRDAYALERAKQAGIDAVCISPRDYADREQFNEALFHTIDEVSPDLVVLAGFLVTIPSQLIREYENRIINIHPSLIPSFCGKGYYGLKVHEAVLKRGVKVTGATVHFVDDGMDTGPIIMQKAVQVLKNDTPESLQQRVMEEAEWVILPWSLALIAAGAVTVENGMVRIAE